MSGVRMTMRGSGWAAGALTTGVGAAAGSCAPLARCSACCIAVGASIVPARTVTAEVASEQLAAIEIESPRMTRPLATIVARNRPRPPGMKEFIALLNGEGPVESRAAR